MEGREIVIELLYKKIEGRLSASEEEWVDKWLNEAEHRAYFGHLQRFYRLQEKSEISDQALEEAWNMMQKRMISNSARRISRFWRVVAIAAGVILLVGFWQLWEFRPNRMEVVSPVQPISPGRPCAVLELADGRVFDLRETNLGERQLLAGKVRLDSGRLDYRGAQGSFLQVASFHKLSVPRGGEFQLVLEDGTKVWMNADSYFSYPERFEENKREVFLEGEAYFEVAKDSCRPFTVYAGDQKITVLGTSFGITSYPNALQTTTLVEGNVKVEFLKRKEQVYFLEPGVQIVYDADREKIERRRVNVKEYVSWKDGRYIFNKKPLETILNTLARWYDFEVVYKDMEVKDILFSGELLRFNNFHDILQAIEKASDVKFSVEDRLVEISNNTGE